MSYTCTTLMPWILLLKKDEWIIIHSNYCSQRTIKRIDIYVIVQTNVQVKKMFTSMFNQMFRYSVQNQGSHVTEVFIVDYVILKLFILSNDTVFIFVLPFFLLLLIFNWPTTMKYRKISTLLKKISFTFSALYSGEYPSPLQTQEINKH